MLKARVTVLYSLIIFTAIVLAAGCTSSSNTIRYDDTGKLENTDSSPARFTSSDDKYIRDSSYESSSNNQIQINDDADIPNSRHTESMIDPTALSSRFADANNSTERKLSFKDKMLAEIVKYLNTPYKFGGESKTGIDCSAFTQTVFSDVLSVPLLRSAREQFTEGARVTNEKSLEFGDLVFFDTGRRVKPGHVGIYIGDGLFAHASSSFGVIVSSLDDEYYANRFMGGRRIEDFAALNRF